METAKTPLGTFVYDDKGYVTAPSNLLSYVGQFKRIGNLMAYDWTKLPDGRYKSDKPITPNVWRQSIEYIRSTAGKFVWGKSPKLGIMGIVSLAFLAFLAFKK